MHTLAEPQPPQWFGSLVVLTSQPFATSMSQSAKPVLHELMAQLELLQTGVALGVVHALPQVPQLLRSLAVWISQPFEATWSQSAKPALHDPMAQLELLQVAVALGSVHTVLQAPQLLGSLVVLTHDVPLQSVGVIVGQPDTHVEDEHNGVPPVHALWQSPQVAARVRLVSQPFATFPSQSLKPALHEAMVQTPALQPAVAWARLHTLPHRPQLLGSPAVLTSQPFAARRSQSV